MTASSKAAKRARPSGAQRRKLLRDRLEARRDEIEAAALTRVRAIADPSEVADPAYADGLRVAVCAAVAYGIQTTGREGPDPPIPVALLAQARLAARAGVSLDTVLRRYFAGYSLLGYFILEEAANAGVTDGDELKRLLGAHAGTFDRLLAAVGEEHARECETRQRSTERRQAEQVERLLAGELVDTSDIPYDFEGWHVGVASTGEAGAERALRDLAPRLDCRLVLLPREDGVLWAWLGSRRRLDTEQLVDAIGPVGDARSAAIALGEPDRGLDGWRLTHRQAAAVLPVARRGDGTPLRYGDVALLASAVHDDLLEASLRRIYLRPLENGRDRGAASRRTLRAYFDHARNVTATASALEVNRSTVAYRLQAIEDRLGRRVDACAAALEIALRLGELGPTDATAQLRHIDGSQPVKPTNRR